MSSNKVMFRAVTVTALLLITTSVLFEQAYAEVDAKPRYVSPKLFFLHFLGKTANPDNSN